MRGPSSCLVALTVAGLGAGCAQLAGIDKTNGDERQVTLTYDRLSIGAKVSTAPLLLDGLTANYLVPDPDDLTKTNLIPADPEGDGLWGAKIRTGTPPVLFTLPDNETSLWTLPSRNMHGTFAALEHPNPTAPPAAAQITVDGALDTAVVAGERFQFLEVGTWASIALTPAVGALTVGPQTFPYASASAPTPLAAMTSDDVILVMRHAAGVLTGLGEMAPAGAQTDATSVTTPITAVTADQTLAMPVDPAAITARFTGEKPAGTGAVAMGWNVTAAPGFANGFSSGPLLASGTVAAADTSISKTYPNPFVMTHGWPSALTFSASRSRSFAPNGVMGASIGLSSSLIEVTAPGAEPVALSAALPLVLTVGITPLNTDNTSVLIDASKPVPVSFTTDGAAATLYEMELFELTPNGTTFTVTPRLFLAGDQPAWAIPGSFLLPGHLYFFRALTIGGGYADISTGDLSTIALPYAVAQHDGGVFTVNL